MTWVPLFEISSKDFEEDINLLKKIFGDFEKQIHFQDGYQFSSEAQFGMGWWFYTIYVKIGFIKGLVSYHHGMNSKIKDERGILELVERQLKSDKSSARIKFHGQKPVLSRYWSWLMR